MTSLSARVSSSDCERSWVRCLQLLEEAHVLDGDHGLVGEGLDQRDLLVGERPDLRRATMAPMGVPSRSIGTARTGRLSSRLAHGPRDFGYVLALGRQVVHVDDPALEHGASATTPVRG